MMDEDDSPAAASLLQQRYQKLEKIGQGTYGKVYKAKDLRSAAVVALKRVSMDDEGVPALVLREVSILKLLHHPNIVSLLDVIILDAKPALRVHTAEEAWCAPNRAVCRRRRRCW